MTLGQKIKRLRTQKNLTQKDLSDKVHVTFQTVSKWENDENEPDISTLRELAKLFGCSMDYLLSEDEVLETKQPEAEPVPEQPVTKTIIIHQKELHVCAKCNKDIPENELYVEHLTRRERTGRASYRTVPVGDYYYHKKCFAEIEAQRAAVKKRMEDERISHAKKVSFGWGVAAGVIGLIASLAIFLAITSVREVVHPALGVLFSVLIGYALFADLYCILSGSYIGDVFVWAAGFTIKFPGLIFSWSLEGFAWLIGMKILFAILGFLIGVATFLGAVALSALLAAVSFPFVLIHNIHTNYSDAL